MKKLIFLVIVIVSGTAFAQGEALAGLSNIAFGMYSWRSGDTLGGVLLTGASVISIGMIIAGEPMAILGVVDSETAITMTLAGVGVFLVQGVVGYFRGVSLYRKQNTVATGFSENPIDHVNFTPVISQDGKNIGLSLMYSTKF